MFRILKFLLGLVALALFIWFGANIPLGTRTLFQHLQAIGKTRETQDFLEGTRNSAKPIVDDVRKRLGGGANSVTDSVKGPIDGGARPADEISPADRQRLRKILNERPTR